MWVDAGALETGCRQYGRKTWAFWIQNAGRLFLGSTVLEVWERITPFGKSWYDLVCETFVL